MDKLKAALERKAVDGSKVRKANLDGDRSERLLPALNVEMCMAQHL